MRRRLLILLAVVAMCLAPGCSVLKPYTGIKFPPGTVCEIVDIKPDGSEAFVVCIMPLPQEGGMPNAA